MALIDMTHKIGGVNEIKYVMELVKNHEIYVCRRI